MDTTKEKLYRTLDKNGKEDFIQDIKILYFWEKFYISKGRERIYSCKFF